MNSFSIAFKLFKNNIKTYGYYISVMIFSVAVYYNFAALKHNPRALVIQDLSNKAETAAQMNSVILLIFLVFFMWFSSAFFLKQRKKEIGIYQLAGVSNVKIGMVFAIESIFVGITAVGAGLLTGILLSKLFLMVLAKVSLLNVTIEFSIPVGAIKESVITFGTIFLALSLRNFISVARNKLIDLINDARKEEGEPKFKVVRGVLAVILIGTGYYLSVGVDISPSFMTTSLVILVLVVLGTYWFFGGFISLVMKFLIGRKDILYRGARIVGINNIAFRLKGNYRSHAMLAVLVATTITAFGTSLSLRYYINNTHDAKYPYSFSYISDDENLNNKVTETIISSSHKLLLNEQFKVFHIEPVKFEDVMYHYPSILAVRFSDFAKVTRELKVKDAEKVIQQADLPGRNIAFIPAPKTIISPLTYDDKKIVIEGVEYTVKRELRTPLLGEGLMGSMPAIVLSDEEYEKLKNNYKEFTFNGYLVSNQENSEELAINLMKMMPEGSGFFPYVKHFRSTYEWIGLFFSLGAFMSLVFILATGSIMYFRLLSEALADKSKYEILSKIGMSKREIKRAVSYQVGLSLILPLIIGILHSFFAIHVLGGLLHYGLIVPTLMAIGVFILAYGAFYIITTRKFLGMVCFGIES